MSQPVPRKAPTVTAGPSVDPGRLCQIEIKVGDATRALSFYEKVFGWTVVPAYIHNYLVLSVPESCPFGISLIPGKASGHPGNTILYFSHEDPEKIAELAEAWGGKRLFSRVVRGYGEIVQIQDPDGQKFGLYRSVSLAR